MAIAPIHLNGLCVLNTRPEPGHQRLKAQIEAAGGISLALPLLKIEPTQDTWLEDLPPLEHFSAAIFISPNAAQLFLNTLMTKKRTLPPSMTLFAIGQQTRQTLSEFGYDAYFAPKAFSEDFLALDALQHLTHQNVLLVKGEGGRTLIHDTLTQRGAVVTQLDVYKRIDLPLDLLSAEQLWHNQNIDIILYTSLQSMNHLHQSLPEVLRTTLINLPCVVFSERLAEGARQHGHKKIIITPPNDLLKALEKFAKG